MGLITKLKLKQMHLLLIWRCINDDGLHRKVWVKNFEICPTCSHPIIGIGVLQCTDIRSTITVSDNTQKQEEK